MKASEPIRRNIAVWMLAGATSFAVAEPHVFTIYAQAPATALPGETFTVEIWGQVQSPLWVHNVSAVAGFGIDVLGTGAVTSVSGTTIAPWALDFGTNGNVVGTNILGTSGGQIFPPIINPVEPSEEFANPIMLFWFTAEAGDAGTLEFTPAHPSYFGGLSFYPYASYGATIVAPNDAGTSLHLISATTLIIPAPGLMVVVLGLALARRQRFKVATIEWEDV